MNNYETSLNKIETMLNNVKNDAGEAYKKVNKCKDDGDHKFLCQKL